MNKKFFYILMSCFIIYMSSIHLHAAGIDQIVVPDGYINNTDKITVTTSEDESKELVSIRVKLDHGAYKDITGTKNFSVDKNCTAFVKIKYRYSDGSEKTNEISKDINNFDAIPPKLSAYIKGEDLLITITDEISGPKLLNIDGKDYSDLDSESIGINLKNLENNAEYFTIYGMDNASNRTNTMRVYNPYYVGEDPKSNSDKTVDNPQSTAMTRPTDSSGEIISHTDEDGVDISNVTYREWIGTKNDNMGSKQFFTIKTKSDKVFYLVVDESYNEQTAYLLTEASENDLLNFVNYDGNTVELGQTNIYTIDRDSNRTKEEAEINKEEPEKKSKVKRSYTPVILVIVLVGIVAYYLKLKKGGSEQDEEEEYDAELDEEKGDGI